MAFDSPAKLRRSVAIAIAIAIAAPIETVVDPHLHHLDVAVPHKVSPARRWNPKGAINVRSSSPRKLYSTFADQLGMKAHSMPAPTSQPLLLLLEAVIDAPVDRLVIVKSSLPTQPPPALP